MKTPLQLRRLWQDQAAPDLVEYVTLALVVSAVVVAALLVIVRQAQALFAA